MYEVPKNVVEERWMKKIGTLNNKKEKNYIETVELLCTHTRTRYTVAT